MEALRESTFLRRALRWDPGIAGSMVWLPGSTCVVEWFLGCGPRVMCTLLWSSIIDHDAHPGVPGFARAGSLLHRRDLIDGLWNV